MPIKVGLKEIEIWNNDSMENSVCRYESEETKKGQIVFYGPSNFTRWSTKWGMTPLREAVVSPNGNPCTVNRGFGSSCPEHHVYYYSRMIRPIEPAVLVYSPGYANANAFGYTPKETWELSLRVLEYFRADFPQRPIYLCGPNLKRFKKEGFAEFDEYLRQYAAATPECHYVDLTAFEPLSRDEYFVADGIHYNKEGYDLYAEFFREVLKEELAKF